MDAKMFVRVTKSQAVVDDFYWFGIDENGQPIDYGKGDKVNVNAIDELETVHNVIIFEKLWMSHFGSGFMETWRSNASHGPTGRLRTEDAGENGGFLVVAVPRTCPACQQDSG